MVSGRFGPFLSAIETASRFMIRPMGMSHQITTDASALESFPLRGCICKGRDKGTAPPMRGERRSRVGHDTEIAADWKKGGPGQRDHPGRPLLKPKQGFQ